MCKLVYNNIIFCSVSYLLYELYCTCADLSYTTQVLPVGKMEKTDDSNVLRLPLPSNVVQQWQVLQRAVGVSQTNTRPQTAVHQSGNGCVTAQVQSSPNGAVSRPRTPAAAVSYSYKVRIINPSKKSDVVSRYLNKYSSKFTAVNAVRVQLIEEFKDQVLDSLTFQIGYFEGSQQAKISLVTDEDLKRMYDIHKTGGQINMWCEGVSNEGANKGHGGSKRKRDDSGVSKHQEKEEDVKDNFKVLQEKHGRNKKFTIPLLRLWARTISAGLHDDFDSPSDLPAFSESQPKKPRKQESLSDTISEAAVSIVHALSGSKGKEQGTLTKGASVSIGISPGKSVNYG